MFTVVQTDQQNLQINNTGLQILNLQKLFWF
jgi:hypothetical protein